MEKVSFDLSPEEAATICAELSLSLADGRCNNQQDREVLIKIIAKLSAPFGFDPQQIQAITKMICGFKPN